MLTKIVHYKLVKITIDTPGLAKVIIDIEVRHHGLPDFIITDRSFLVVRQNFGPCYAIF